MLNERQKNIYEFIVSFIDKNQIPPTVREICEGVGIKSTSTVSSDLKALTEKNYIKKHSLKSRSIEITKNNYDISNLNIEEPKIDTINVPIIGNVAAGSPILAEENIEDFFPIPSYYSKFGNVFMLKVKGESMIEAGIFEGDKILVRSQNTANNGDIVIALIENEATVKTYSNSNGIIKLIPHNSTMEPIIPEKLEILGKVIGLFRDYY